MVILPKASADQSSGLSLTELLIVVAAIGIIAAIAVPTTATFRQAALRAAATQNAKNIAQMSEALAALGVAHVIPDSMGGRGGNRAPSAGRRHCSRGADGRGAVSPLGYERQRH